MSVKDLNLFSLPQMWQDVNSEASSRIVAVDWNRGWLSWTIFYSLIFLNICKYNIITVL